MTFTNDGKGKPPRRLPLRVRISAVAAVLGIVIGLFALKHSGGDRTVTHPYPEDETGPAPALVESTPPSGPESALPFRPQQQPALEGAQSTLGPLEIPVRSGNVTSVMTRDGAARPVRLIIDAIDVDARIVGVGHDRGEMEVPARADTVGWYEYGPAPGESGSSVLAAHVDWDGRRGVFFSLRELPPGARIVIEFEDGSQRVFRSASLAAYEKADLPTSQIFARNGPAVLTLITCGGPFNRSIGSYRDNLVVFATEFLVSRTAR